MEKNKLEILNDNLFVNQLEYKKGDVVVWRGNNPAILRIGHDFKFNNIAFSLECAKTTNKQYNSLHYSHLRIATRQESELLGNLDIILLTKI